MDSMVGLGMSIFAILYLAGTDSCFCKKYTTTVSECIQAMVE